MIKIVGTEGLEPTWVSPLAPKASASASFATCPLRKKPNYAGVKKNA
jgi:hypothetical protein